MNADYRPIPCNFLKKVRTLVRCIDKFLGNGSACRLRPGGSDVKSVPFSLWAKTQGPKIESGGGVLVDEKEVASLLPIS